MTTCTTSSADPLVVVKWSSVWRNFVFLSKDYGWAIKVEDARTWIKPPFAIRAALRYGGLVQKLSDAEKLRSKFRLTTR